jgi:hypothetical protein
MAKKQIKKYAVGGKTGTQLKAEGQNLKKQGKILKAQGTAAKIVGTIQKDRNTPGTSGNKTVDAVMNVIGTVASPSGPANALKAASGLARMARLAPKVKAAAKTLATAPAKMTAKVAAGIKTTNPVARKLGIEAGKKDIIAKAFRSGKAEMKNIIKAKRNPQTKLKLK